MKFKSPRLWALIFFLVSAAYPLSAQNLSLDDALKTLGSSGPDQAELRWDPFFESGVFSSNGHYAAFVSGSPGETGPVLLDNREILSLPLPYRDQGALWFPSSFVSQLKAVFERYAEEDRNRFRIAAIIVDPGHGGKDTGAIGEHIIDGKPFKSVEKDITLKVSGLLHSRLAAAFPDKRVLMTREGDTYPTLEDRVALANAVPLRDNEAVIYISIHANASFNKHARGYEVWYLSPGYRREVIDPARYADSREVIPILNSMMEEEFTTESILMAQSILESFREVLGSTMPSRGLKEEEWFVVRNARMPSVLVELGFVTNEADARLMNDNGYLKNLSDALYKGITDFIALFERSGGFTAVQ
ncbi:MAG: N-acetylmuramoyl-L-alanine amidase [Treponema sp.]|nr:N-acetylmuramoyl-L-alanine amidase [Treponema sp.]